MDGSEKCVIPRKLPKFCNNECCIQKEKRWNCCRGDVSSNYNSHMGFVDKFDKFKGLYEVDRKLHKWWNRILFYFVNVCIVNAFILFQLQSQSRRLNLKKYSVARELIGAVEPSKRGRLSREKPVNKFKKLITLEVRQSKTCHMPERSTSLRCANCSTTKEVSIKHDKNCFVSYHVK
ncbi:hypothetical protein NQ314_012648 [Rhamnusium bicolor]|uniref:PiggyBac transposable element-derived protein domain-containing protein n=1 Tax=Rhamnusium bicolor TaxID=1586634 RepID=A0AAV8XBG3_9CUCU|nr:hypothetical protein NQ314_012648 [Rhamnusium bicolor]